MKSIIYTVSYGTRLGRIQELHPSKLNSVILNSPNPLVGDIWIIILNNINYCNK